MAGFVYLDLRQRTGMAIFDIDDASFEPLIENPFDRLGHFGAGLTCSDNPDPIVCGKIIGALLDLQ